MNLVEKLWQFDSVNYDFGLKRACLTLKRAIYKEQILFKIKKHEVYTVNKHKIILNRGHDKKLVQADCIQMLARRYLG